MCKRDRSNANIILLFSVSSVSRFFSTCRTYYILWILDSYHSVSVSGCLVIVVAFLYFLKSFRDCHCIEKQERKSQYVQVTLPIQGPLMPLKTQPIQTGINDDPPAYHSTGHYRILDETQRIEEQNSAAALRPRLASSSRTSSMESVRSTGNMNYRQSSFRSTSKTTRGSERAEDVRHEAPSDTQSVDENNPFSEDDETNPFNEKK